MLDIQRTKDREKARLMSEEGMTAEEADAHLDNDIKPFRPKYPRKAQGSNAKTPAAAVKTKKASLFDRVRTFHLTKGDLD